MSIHRVVLTGIYLGQKCQNVVHINNPDGALTNLAIKNEFNAQFITPLRNLQNNQAAWTQLAVRTVGLGPPGPEEIFIISGNGSLAGTGATPVLAGVFSIRTGVAGPHGHGRFYLWGVHGASVVNGQFESGAFTAYQGAAVAIENRWKTGGTGPLDLGVAPRNAEELFIPMTSLVVRNIFGVQRRRNFGVGS
jgi:hypothetical protein